MKRILLALFIVMNIISFSSPEKLAGSILNIGDYREEFIVGDYRVSVVRLLAMTAMVESRFGLDDYSGRIAKGVYQLEEATASHYIGLAENEIQRIKDIAIDDDTRNAYLVYYSKLHFHKDIISTALKNDTTCDNEWVVYKTLWNTHKGHSTYSKWKQRNNELRGL